MHSGVRRTRRRQPLVADVREVTVQSRQHLALVKVGGLRTVETDQLDFAACLQEAAKIVDDDARSHDRRIQTAGPFCRGDDIPKRNAVSRQALRSLRVWQLRPCGEKLPHDAPEGVPWLGVVLLRFERAFTREATENEDRGVAVGDGGEALGRHC